MHRRIGLIVAMCLVTLLFGGHADKIQSKEIELIKPGDLFPEVPMQVPAEPAERKYLGLSESETFTLKEIKTDLVLVEIISVYCPSCQRQVPAYNKLYSLIENDPKMKGRMKLIGFAAGNGDLEVKDFKKRYNVLFPIVPDPGFDMHQAIGGSRTPFTIYVRQDPTGWAGVVAGTHLGRNRHYKRLFAKLGKMMALDLAALRKESRKKKGETIVVKPILTDAELQSKVKGVFTTLKGEVTGFQKLNLKSSTVVYTALVGREGVYRRFFARVTSRPPTCDVCHDIHFIYIFDSSGEVVRFEPLQLTKYGNKLWNKADIAKMRARVLGRHISQPYTFDPKVDAVSSATITSAVIIDAIFKGKSLLKELEEKGLI